jgi:hypothetical protein
VAYPGGLKGKTITVRANRMDAEDYATQGLGNVPEVVEHVKEVRKEGMGVVAMKLRGEGTFQVREPARSWRNIAIALIDGF